MMERILPAGSLDLFAGEYRFAEHWALTVVGPMRHRVEEGSLVLWRKGLTIWITVWQRAATAPRPCSSSLSI